MYIVNYTDNNGCTFISSDRRSGSVIAFIDQGNFTITDIASNSLDKMLVELFINYQASQLGKLKTEDKENEKLLAGKELFGFFYGK